MIGVRADGTQGARRPGRRLPRVDRVVGGPAARLRTPRHARPGARGRRRRARVLGRAARGVPRRPGSSAAGSTRSPTCSAALPKSAHPGAKKALAEIWNAEDRDHALDAVDGVQARLRREVRQGRREDHRRPRRAARVLRLPRRALDPPAHHQPDRVDLRHRPAPHQGHQGPGLKAAGLAMAFKLIEAAQARWRAVNAPHLVALVRAGATFVNGQLVERPAEAVAA